MENAESLTVAVFDIETANDCGEVDWDASEIEFACGVIQFATMHPNGAVELESNRVYLTAAGMVTDLLNTDYSDVIVGHNAWRFDLPVLAWNAHAPMTLHELRARCFDTLRWFKTVTGHKHAARLDHLRQACGLALDTRHHAAMPKLWAADRRTEVIEGCRKDVADLVAVLAAGLVGPLHPPALNGTDNATIKGWWNELEGRYDVPTSWWTQLTETARSAGADNHEREHDSARPLSG